MTDAIYFPEMDSLLVFLLQKKNNTRNMVNEYSG